MSKRRPLSYDCRRTVLQHIEANKRFQLAQRCPQLEISEKKVPLTVDHLVFEPMTVTVNDTKYELAFFKKRFCRQVNDLFSKYDHDDGMRRIDPPNAIMTPGDVIIAENPSDRPRLHMDGGDRERLASDLAEQRRLAALRVQHNGLFNPLDGGFAPEVDVVHEIPQRRRPINQEEIARVVALLNPPGRVERERRPVSPEYNAYFPEPARPYPRQRDQFDPELVRIRNRLLRHLGSFDDDTDSGSSDEDESASGPSNGAGPSAVHGMRRVEFPRPSFAPYFMVDPDLFDPVYNMRARPSQNESIVQERFDWLAAAPSPLVRPDYGMERPSQNGLSLQQQLEWRGAGGAPGPRYDLAPSASRAPVLPDHGLGRPSQNRPSLQELRRQNEGVAAGPAPGPRDGPAPSASRAEIRPIGPILQVQRRQNDDVTSPAPSARRAERAEEPPRRSFASFFMDVLDPGASDRFRLGPGRDMGHSSQNGPSLQEQSGQNDGVANPAPAPRDGPGPLTSRAERAVRSFASYFMTDPDPGPSGPARLGPGRDTGHSSQNGQSIQGPQNDGVAGPGPRPAPSASRAERAWESPRRSFASYFMSTPEPGSAAAGPSGPRDGPALSGSRAGRAVRSFASYFMTDPDPGPSDLARLGPGRDTGLSSQNGSNLQESQNDGVAGPASALQPGPNRSGPRQNDWGNLAGHPHYDGERPISPPANREDVLIQRLIMIQRRAEIVDEVSIRRLICPSYIGLIQLTITSPRGVKVERYQYSMKLYETFKALNTKFFGKRSHPVTVRLLESNHFPVVYRLPENIKFKIYGLKCLGKIDTVHDCLKPILEESSLPLEYLEFDDYTETFCQHPMVTTARKLVITSVFASQNWVSYLKSLAIPKIRLARELPARDFILLVYFLMGSGQPVGKCMEFGINVESTAHTVFQMIRARFNVSSSGTGYLILRINASTVLRVSYERNERNDRHLELGMREMEWMLKMEVKEM